MTFKQVYNQLTEITIELVEVDRTYWVDRAVEEFEEAMNRTAYEEVVAQATSKALIYKLNHKRSMPHKQKVSMIRELLKEHGLFNT